MDVKYIMQGYRLTPNLLHDGLRWWHGPWIEQGVDAYRPLASYLLWIECWIGVRHGYVWVGWIGVALFVLDCWLAAMVSLRLLRSWRCALLTAVLAPAITVWNWGGQQPRYWLIWFPGHQDLLMIAFLLGALIDFHAWMLTSSRRDLARAWILFALGALTKEFDYVFPLFALALTLIPTLTRTLGMPNVVSRMAALRQVALMAALPSLMMVFRHFVLPHPYNPPAISYTHLYWSAVLFLFPSFLRNLHTPEYIGLAALIFVWGLGYSHARRQQAWHRRLARPFGWLAPVGCTAAVFWLYLHSRVPIQRASAAGACGGSGNVAAARPG